MTDPTQPRPDDGDASPDGWAYRSGADVAVDPDLSPAAAYALTVALDGGSSDSSGGRSTVLDGLTASRRERVVRAMWLALAQRPDLDAATATALVERTEWHHSHLAVALLSNDAVADLPQVLDLLSPDLIPVLLTDPDRFARAVVLMTARHPDVARAHAEGAALIDVARARLGRDRIRQVEREVLADDLAAREAPASPLPTYDDPDGVDSADRTDLAALASSPLLTPDGRRDVIARATASPERQRHYLLDRLVTRPDLTAEDARAIIAACQAASAAEPDRRSRHSHLWPLMRLVTNPKAPVEAYTALACHRSRVLSDAALTSESCPDEARWAAVHKHRPWALSGGGPIPRDVAMVAINDLPALRSGRLGARRVSAASAVSRSLAARVSDPDVLALVLDDYLEQSATPHHPSLAVAQFIAAATRSLVPWHADRHAENREDSLLRMLASHSSPAARAVAVANLLTPGDLAAAAADPAAEVRRECVKHPLLSAATLSALADDADPGVRAAAAERVLRALDGAP